MSHIGGAGDPFHLHGIGSDLGASDPGPDGLTEPQKQMIERTFQEYGRIRDTNGWAPAVKWDAIGQRLGVHPATVQAYWNRLDPRRQPTLHEPRPRPQAPDFDLSDPSGIPSFAPPAEPSQNPYLEMHKDQILQEYDQNPHHWTPTAIANWVNSATRRPVVTSEEARDFLRSNRTQVE